MKKMITMVLSALMVLTMALSLTACGEASEEQLKTLDTKMTKYETLVASAQAETDKLTAYMEQYEIESLKESYDKLIPMMTQINDLVKQTRTAYDQNRSSYTGEQADKLSASLDTQIESSEKFQNELKDLVTKVEEAIQNATEAG